MKTGVSALHCLGLLGVVVHTVRTPLSATSLCRAVMAIPIIFGVLVLHPKVMGESIVSALSTLEL
jgi:hypothetical protein